MRKSHRDKIKDRRRKRKFRNGTSELFGILQHDISRELDLAFMQTFIDGVTEKVGSAFSMPAHLIRETGMPAPLDKLYCPRLPLIIVNATQ